MARNTRISIALRKRCRETMENRVYKQLRKQLGTAAMWGSLEDLGQDLEHFCINLTDTMVNWLEDDAGRG
jgi:hypothetical protein